MAEAAARPGGEEERAGPSREGGSLVVPSRGGRDLTYYLEPGAFEDVLELLGVVFPSEPPFRRVQIHFAPDRRGAGLEPVRDTGADGVLMARGPYPAEGRPFKLTVTARR